MNYLIWYKDNDDQYCHLESLGGVEDDYELRRGIPRKEGFPDGAYFEMSGDFPKSIKLADCLNKNIGSLIVVSKRLKESLEAEKIPNNEFLRVTIINHKKKIASKEYFILNPIGLQDCVDRDKSVIKWNRIDPNLITGVKKLVIDETKIEPTAMIFRPKYLPTIILLRKDLAQKIEEAGFTGFSVKEVEKFTQ